MEFKDLLKLLEEYYAKASELQAVRKKWCENELKIKSEKFEIQSDSRRIMTNLQDIITSELNYIFSIYRENEKLDIEIVKNSITHFIVLANMWLECFEENKGE